MCGIIGLFNNGLRVKKGLSVMRNRGLGAEGSVKLERGELGHYLHAIVSHVPQPLRGEGVLVANCEI